MNNTNIAESYANNVVNNISNLTKESIISIVKQAYLDGMNGVGLNDDTVDFVDDMSEDYIPTEDDVDINDFDAFTPKFMQK